MKSVIADVVENTVDSSCKIVDDFCSMDHVELSLKGRLPKSLQDDLNLWELGLGESVTVNQLLIFIAKRTFSIWDKFIRESEVFPNENVSIPTWEVCNSELMRHNLLSWMTVKKEDVLWRYAKALRRSRYGEYRRTGKRLVKEEDWLCGAIYNHKTGEFTEDFLWHVMEYYWNYHLNRIIFEHFLDQHKSKYKIYKNIIYTTEIHRFLYEVIKNDSITPKEAFSKIIAVVEDHNDINILHTLFQEMMGYNGNDDIADIIDYGIDILCTLKSDHRYATWLGSVRTLVWQPKVKYYSNLRETLHYLKIKWKDLSLENILFHWDKILFNLYWVPSPTDLYTRGLIFWESNEVTEEGENESDKIVRNKKELWPKEYLFGYTSVFVGRLFLDYIPKVDKCNDNLTTFLRAKYLPDNEKKVVETKKEDLAEEESIKLWKFTENLKAEIESNTKAVRDELQWKKPSFWRKMFLKMASKKSLEEFLKLGLLTSKNWKIVALLFLKVWTQIMRAVLWGVALMAIRTRKLRRWWITIWIKRSYRSSLSHKGTNFICENAKELRDIAYLESRKRSLENILTGGKNILDNSQYESYQSELDSIINDLEGGDLEEMCWTILAHLKESASLQSKSIHETLVEKWFR